MITKNDLEQAAKLKSLSMENCEKDYFQDLVLFNLYRQVGKEFVFKGGTCLYKIYKLNRFSEDLDFTVTKRIDIDKIMRLVVYSLQSLNIGTTLKEMDKFQNQINIRMAFRGPLYKGTKESMLVLTLNLSSRERPVNNPKKEMILPIYRDIPSFEIFAMDENEMVVEKIKTIFERNKPRDAYDLWFLLKIKGFMVDYGLVSKKIGKFDRNEFSKKLEEKAQNWERELKRFIIGTLPPFSQVKKEIEERI
ncbi:MAG: nucleotidyl transferase AbiEii/AbiGii toxin family protein [Candidatus Micrarchaeota archaeon]